MPSGLHIPTRESTKDAIAIPFISRPMPTGAPGCCP